MEHVDNFAAFQIDDDCSIPAAFNQLQSSIPTTRSGLSEEAAALQVAQDPVIALR